MIKPRLEEGDLVSVRRLVTVKGEKIKPKDIGILLNIKIVNGYATGKVFWQQTQKYTEEMPTEHLIRVATQSVDEPVKEEIAQ